MGNDYCDWTDTEKVLATLAKYPLHSITPKAGAFSFLSNDEKVVIDTEQYFDIYKAMLDYKLIENTGKTLEIEGLSDTFPVCKILFAFTEEQASSHKMTCLLGTSC
jgi:hypothetical protein